MFRFLPFFLPQVSDDERNGRVLEPERERLCRSDTPARKSPICHAFTSAMFPDCIFLPRSQMSLRSPYNRLPELKTWPSDPFGAFRRIRPQRPNSVPFPASQTSSIVPPPLLTPSPLLAVSPLLLHLCPSVFPWRRRRRPLASMQCHTPPTIPDWPSVRTSGEDRRRAFVPLGRNRPTEGLFEGGSASAVASVRRRSRFSKGKRKKEVWGSPKSRSLAYIGTLYCVRT